MDWDSSEKTDDYRYSLCEQLLPLPKTEFAKGNAIRTRNRAKMG